MAALTRRLGFFGVTLWAAITINFLLPRMMPGNPAIATMARFKGKVSPQTIRALETAFGVHNQQPIVVQYFQYLGDVLQGHFGISLALFPDPVSRVVAQALPWTLGLVGITTVLAFVIGTGVGMVAAWRRGGVVDSLLPPIFMITSAFPYFWIGLLLIYVFGVTLRWLPNGFAYDSDLGQSVELSWTFVSQVIWHGILPGLTIVLTSIGGWILTMRNNMITTLAEDYVKMARAKGLSPFRIMLEYAGRNAILPNLTGFAMSIGFVVSGAILVEYVFTYPGLGYILLQAVKDEDFPLMQALFLMITVAVLVAVLISDLATLWLDPRTRGRR